MATIESAPPAVGPHTQAVIDTFNRYVVPNYRRFPVCLVRGEGSRVWDAEGAEKLGCGAEDERGDGNGGDGLQNGAAAACGAGGAMDGNRRDVP